MTRTTASTATSELQIRGIGIRYFTREPSPNSWNAVGLIGGSHVSTIADHSDSARMIVGRGKTRDEAIGDLTARVLTEYSLVDC